MLGDSLAPSEQALGATFPDRLEAALRSVARLPHTLLHCDLRSDNLLFSPDGSQVTLVDWQGAGVGPPSFDLAYFDTSEGRRAYTADVAPWFDMGLLSVHGKEEADRRNDEESGEET